MSRTYKDKPFKFKYPDFWDTWPRNADKPKKKKSVDTEWHWMGDGPSWFHRMFHTVPKRRAIRDWAKKVIYATDLEIFDDCPDYGRKPHIYWW